MENRKTTLDEVLDKFSMFGRYHLQLMFFTLLTFAYTAMFAHTYIFAAEESGYRCKDESFNNTCGSIGGEQCSEWIYDNPYSFMAEYQLACQEWKRTLVGTLHSCGYMLGLFMVGPLSDRIGRKKAFIWTGVMGGVLGLAKSFSNSYWLYVTLEFLGDLLGDNYSPMYMLRFPWLSIMVYMACTLMSSFFFDITYIYTSELFPTCTRNSMHAFCSAVGRIGSISAPQTPLLLAYWSGLPTLFFGGASLVAGLITFLVPDTADDALPDTVREAENIGKRKKRVTIGIDNLGMTQE